MSASTSLTIRPARDVDGWALLRLAGLDSTRPLAGDVLLAEADGHPVAAVEVATGRAAADPFLPTAAAVDVLRMRAGQLTASRAPRRPRLRRAALRASTG